MGLSKVFDHLRRKGHAKTFQLLRRGDLEGVRQILDKSLKKSMLFRVTNLKEIRASPSFKSLSNRDI